MSVLETFIPSWNASAFSTNTSQLDLAMSAVSQNSTAAQNAPAIKLLLSLQTLLNALYTNLTALGNQPKLAASKERALAASIVQTMEERNYTSAEDLFLRGQVVAALASTLATASFASNLLNAVANVAQNDVAYPDIANDRQVPVATTAGA